jgi:hypothetical protein
LCGILRVLGIYHLMQPKFLLRDRRARYEQPVSDEETRKMSADLKKWNKDNR